jgi:DNA-directed RNA polymerase subunit alpha
LEITVEKGRGYIPAEENKPANAAIGVIAIDAIFTPIKSVSYRVENIRVEQKTDYEKLIIDIQTDGSINPEQALERASKLIIEHFLPFADSNMVLETSDDEEAIIVDEELLRVRKLLKTPLVELGLSVRAFNCLKAAEVKTLSDLAGLEVSDMMKFRNFGKKSLKELEELIASKNLSFGMDISKYKLDEA